MTRRKLTVHAAQVAVLIIVFGGWQLFTSLKIVDPFFFGQPSGIVSQAWDWVRHGTSFGSIWLQISTTMDVSKSFSRTAPLPNFAFCAT